MTRPPFAPGSTLTVQDVADLIDHALLKPELTPDEVAASVRELAAHRIWSVCVRPSDVALATATIAEVDGSPTRVCTVIGFPHGTTSTAAKVAESRQALADGATELDMVLIMTVEPGFGGQRFLDLCLPKIRRTRELIERHGIEMWLQVDGGVSLETIERCAEAGADVFVAGSAVYSAEDPDAMVEALRSKGIPTGPSESVDAAEVIGVLGMENRDLLRGERMASDAEGPFATVSGRNDPSP